MLQFIQCAVCGATFRSERDNARYCSQACREQAQHNLESDFPLPTRSDVTHAIVEARRIENELKRLCAAWRTLPSLDDIELLRACMLTSGHPEAAQALKVLAQLEKTLSDSALPSRDELDTTFEDSLELLATNLFAED